MDIGQNKLQNLNAGKILKQLFDVVRIVNPIKKCSLTFDHNIKQGRKFGLAIDTYLDWRNIAKASSEIQARAQQAVQIWAVWKEGTGIEKIGEQGFGGQDHSRNAGSVL